MDELHDLATGKASDEFSAKAIGEERHKAEHDTKLGELLKVCEPFCERMRICISLGPVRDVQEGERLPQHRHRESRLRCAVGGVRNDIQAGNPSQKYTTM